MGTLAEEAEEAIDALNEQGKNVGVIRIRSFRPFPVERIREVAKNYDKLLIIDRGQSFGSSTPLTLEIKTALYGQDKPVFTRVMGTGGKDVDYSEIMEAIREVYEEEI